MRKNLKKEKMMIISVRTIVLLFLFLFSASILYSDENSERDINNPADSVKKVKELLQAAKVKSEKADINVVIRNVDISDFPEIKVVIEAYNIFGEPLDTLSKNDISLLENDSEREVISVEKISVRDRIPVDFVFIVDQTGSMQYYIDAVIDNMEKFSNSLIKRGIDFRISLVLFSDIVDKIYEPTEYTFEFTKWLSIVNARGGNDIPENALEAIEIAVNHIQFRPAANKVGVLITDAPFHEKDGNGAGNTDQTAESIVNLMNDNSFRLFTIAPTSLSVYKEISEKTRGNNFDIDYPFATILNIFSNQLTNLYALKYKTDEPAIPYEVDIALIQKKAKRKFVLVRKTIPIVELGRKLIIENLLYKTASSDLPDEVSELNVLTEFMNNKPNVTILVEGHTDDVGSHRINDALSLKRAESVKKYLVKKGISPLRIKTKGYGERKPIADNGTAEGRKLNRRTEIIIVSK